MFLRRLEGFLSQESLLNFVKNVGKFLVVETRPNYSIVWENNNTFQQNLRGNISDVVFSVSIFKDAIQEGQLSLFYPFI